MHPKSKLHEYHVPESFHINLAPKKAIITDDLLFSSSNPWIRQMQSVIQQQNIEILTQNVTINCDISVGKSQSCENSKRALSDAKAVSPSVVAIDRLASVADLPDYALTLGSFNLGDVTFSNSTLKDQSLPLGVDVVAAKGCDFMITSLLKELHQMKAIPVAKTGQFV